MVSAQPPIRSGSVIPPLCIRQSGRFCELNQKERGGRRSAITHARLRRAPGCATPLRRGGLNAPASVPCPNGSIRLHVKFSGKARHNTLTTAEINFTKPRTTNYSLPCTGPPRHATTTEMSPGSQLNPSLHFVFPPSFPGIEAVRVCRNRRFASV